MLKVTCVGFFRPDGPLTEAVGYRSQANDLYSTVGRNECQVCRYFDELGQSFVTVVITVKTP